MHSCYYKKPMALTIVQRDLIRLLKVILYVEEHFTLNITSVKQSECLDLAHIQWFNFSSCCCDVKCSLAWAIMTL